VKCGSVPDYENQGEGGAWTVPAPKQGPLGKSKTRGERGTTRWEGGRPTKKKRKLKGKEFRGPGQHHGGSWGSRHKRPRESKHGKTLLNQKAKEERPQNLKGGGGKKTRKGENRQKRPLVKEMGNRATPGNGKGGGICFDEKKKGKKQVQKRKKLLAKTRCGPKKRWPKTPFAKPNKKGERENKWRGGVWRRRGEKKNKGGRGGEERGEGSTEERGCMSDILFCWGHKRGGTWDPGGGGTPIVGGKEGGVKGWEKKSCFEKQKSTSKGLEGRERAACGQRKDRKKNRQWRKRWSWGASQILKRPDGNPTKGGANKESKPAYLNVGLRQQLKGEKWGGKIPTRKPKRRPQTH